MLRSCLVFLLFLAFPAIVAFAQGGRDHLGTAQQQRACRSDVLRFCADMQDRDDYAMANCLRAHKQRLTSTCRRSLESSDRQSQRD
jgi:hypothetical protein